MEIDTTTPWMDRAWMQNILRDVENDSTLSITDYQVNNMGNKGDNYLSEMQRISINLECAGNKHRKLFLIAKKLPPGKEILKTLSESSAFPNEIKMFKHILPQFHSALEAAAPGKFQPFAARHIYSQSNFPYFLIVTDLAPEGFRMATRQQGLDLDHCLHVMKTLGRFHALSIALHDRDPQLIESFKDNFLIEEASSHLMQTVTTSAISSLAKAVMTWPEGGEAMANNLLKVLDTFPKQYRSQLSSEGNILNVLIHGDLWVNNMLFKYNDVSGNVEDIRLVDFQLACYTSCAIDLHYFISTSPRDDVRAAHTDDLLREYHNELVSTLQLLGLANKAITFQELIKEYERKEVFGFLTSLFALSHVMSDSENAVDLEATLGGTEQSELTDKRFTNKEYIQVMKRLLPLFKQKGLF